MPIGYPKIKRIVELAIDMINGNEIASIQVNSSKLAASFHTASLYSSYDNFHKGKDITVIFYFFILFILLTKKRNN